MTRNKGKEGKRGKGKWKEGKVESIVKKKEKAGVGKL